MTVPRVRPSLHAVVLLLAVGIALLGAQPWAGGWNDGSRLATVESLVDRGTFAIDDSIFVQPAFVAAGQPPPYPVDQPGLLMAGTGDKMRINGHFYSDKSPVPAVLLAGVYRLMQGLTGITARTRPDWFCWLLNALSAGLAYIVAVAAILALAQRLGLEPAWSLTVTASFALATVALPYSRQVNNHILLLAVAAVLTYCVARLAEGSTSSWLLALLGSLAGLAYAIDLGAGPLLLLCVGGLALWRCPRWQSAVLVGLGALPWLLMHHGLNYMVGGSWKPANANPEYFTWPGSTFDPSNMTGFWTHPHLGRFLLYAGDLLVGKNGFLGHNLPLFLAVVGYGWLLWRRPRELPELVALGGWCLGTWLLYAVTSTNHSGQCCSVRWFVPLLAPGYLVLIVLLRDLPACRGDFLLLSAWGLIVGGLTWQKGPWMQRMVPGYWFLLAGALLSWGAWRWRIGQQGKGTVSLPAETAVTPARAA